MIDPQVAFDKLAQFETADEIASYFRSINIFGRLQDAFECPVANYMRQNTGLSFGVCPDDTISYEPKIEFVNTPAINSFVADFDQGAYEELVIEYADEVLDD